MATKTRKPTSAQLRALRYLVEGTPRGREWWYDAQQVERAATWLACEKAGWVTLVRDLKDCGAPPEHWYRPTRVKITDAGREACPTA